MRARMRILAAFLIPGVFADCSHNNCLRAVIGEAFPTRDGARDCSSYLRVTITPPTSTFTATLTVPTLIIESSTIVDISAAFETIVESTETVYSQATIVTEQTATETDVSTITRTVEPNGLAARDATSSGSTFPAYASPCSNFVKYQSACSCMGFSPDTVTVAAPSTTVTVVAPSSSTSTYLSTLTTTSTSSSFVTETSFVTSTVVSTTDATTTTSTTATAVVTNIVRNGRFSSYQLSPWIITRNSQVSGSIVAEPGGNSVLKTGNMYNNNLFEMKQLLAGVPGTSYECQYDYFFSQYYETTYKDGTVYVPYCHIYLNNDITDNVTPEPPSLPGQWYTSSFSFTASGSDTLWFDCASPQARAIGGNYVQLDNVSCVASR